MKPSRFLTALIATLAGPLLATDNVTVKSSIENITIAASGGVGPIDLRNHFDVASITGTLVRFDTNFGTFHVEMFDSGAPDTVENFLSYVNGARYTDTFVHRSDTGTRIIQGGGFRATAGFPPVATFPPIPLETSVTYVNTRGRIAMARTSDLNSATGQWFINTGDNGATLPRASDNGYAVFGRVVGVGMNIVDAIAALPVASSLASPFSQLPFTGSPPAPNPDGSNLSKLVKVNSVIAGSVFPPANGIASYVGFTLTNTNPGLVRASIEGSILNLPVAPNRGGIAKLEILATDAEGKSVTIPFTITVTGGASENLDLTGDSIDDLVFQNDAGQIIGWRMDGAAKNAGAFWIHTDGLGDWKVAAQTDVNGDGITDLILQNTIGQVYALLMNGSGGLDGAQWLVTSSTGDWRVVGAADMNQDGTADFVLRNSAGQLLTWLTDGKGGIIESKWVCLDERLGGWGVAAVTDIDLDGINDIVFQHGKGQIVAWLLDGSGNEVNLRTAQGLKDGAISFLYSGALGTWRVATFADVNGDGIPDMIFQSQNGLVYVWCMDGSGSAIDTRNGSGLKPGSGFIHTGRMGDWRVR